MKTFLKKTTIEEILIRKNKSQNWLAFQIEVSTGYMSQLMDGSRCPSAKVRERVMKKLPGFCFDDLFEIRKNDG